MAAIIDDQLFQFNIRPQPSQVLTPNALIENLSKYMNLNGELTSNNRLKTGTFTMGILCLEQTQYLVTLSFQKDCGNLMVRVRQLIVKDRQDSSFKNRQMLLIKDLIKSQYDKAHEAIYYAERGSITMVLRYFFEGLEQNKKYWIQYWSKAIAKNIHIYHSFSKSLYRKLNSPQADKLCQLHEELLVCRAVSTTPGNLDICYQRSQFKLAQEALQRQRLAISQIRQCIVMQSPLQRLSSNLFQIMKTQSYSKWLCNNLINSYEDLHSKAKKILMINKPQVKKIQDFIYNMAHIEIKQKAPNIIGCGGSSVIYVAKAYVNIVSSTDFSQLRRKIQKADVILAIKEIRPQLSKELFPKLVHEKEIISKMRGSCSVFFPKYYGTSNASELSRALAMEVVNGPQLDDFFRIKSYSSLWTRILILINILQGVRHLVGLQIVHLDLKPANIKVCDNLITKIFDFGEAYHKDVCKQQYCPGYTFPYSSPQVYQRFQNKKRRLPLRKIEFNQKQDVFAFGIIMYEVIFERKIINLSNQKSREVYYSNQIRERVYECPESLRAFGSDPIMSSLLSIIIKCLHPRPQCRPRFDWIGVALKIILNSHIHS